MIFKTHDRTPRIKSNNGIQALLMIEIGLLYSMFLFGAVATSIMAESIVPSVLILSPVLLLTLVGVIIFHDMKKAFVEITDDCIRVVDYYFLMKKEKHFYMDDIKDAKIKFGYSFAVRGYRYSEMGISYIVFRDENKKYLFKILNCPETIEFFSKYIDIETL